MLVNQLTVIAQRDPHWAFQRLGTVDGTTIGQEGCYDTCFAIVAQYAGHKEASPATIDDAATNKLYVDGNLATDDMLEKIYPDCKYQQTIPYANDPADLNKLKDLLSDPTIAVILELDFDHDPNDGIQTHFVVAASCDGTKVVIDDPWYAEIIDFTEHYGNNPQQTILKFVIYKVPTPTAQVTVDSDTFNKLVHNSNVSDALDDLFKLPHNSDWSVVQPKIEALNKAVSDAQANAKEDDEIVQWYKDIASFIGYTGDINQYPSSQATAAINEQKKNAVAEGVQVVQNQFDAYKKTHPDQPNGSGGTPTPPIGAGGQGGTDPCANQNALLKQVHDIVYSSQWWWNKVRNIQRIIKP